MAKLLTRNAQSCFLLGGHKLLYAALIINLLFSLQMYQKGPLWESALPPFLYSGGQKKPEAACEKLHVSIKGQLHFHLDALLLWPEDREKLCWLSSEIESSETCIFPSSMIHRKGGPALVLHLGWLSDASRLAEQHWMDAILVGHNCVPKRRPHPIHPLWRVVNLAGLLCALGRDSQNE